VNRYVLDFDEIDETRVAQVGGKAARLAELTRIQEVQVPAGYCVTTDAFRRVTAQARAFDDLLDRLSRLEPHDADGIRSLSGEARTAIRNITVPDEVAAAITLPLHRLGDGTAYAVRSSATAEDSSTASFAGQQDTYLNVVGANAVLEHVRRCWASLFTERAVSYRLRQGLDHRRVSMAVVVQRMVFPTAAGVLFTADPVTGNRKVAVVEAVVGLGEALVSGLVNADTYRVRNRAIVTSAVAAKAVAIHASLGGGTEQHEVDPAQQTQPALTEKEAIRLVDIARAIEAHFGRPQDIEWCLADDAFQIVQSRPITTLFPIPTAPDGGNHVYLSVGHQQMMTDPMKPLGLSLFQLTAARPMHEAAGRLFVDVTSALASPASRAGLLEMIGQGDPLFRDALEGVLDRDDFPLPPPAGGLAPPPAVSPPAPIETDRTIVTELIRRNQNSVAALKRDIRGRFGAELLDFIRSDIQEMKRILFDPRSHQVFMTAVDATHWLNRHLETWLGEKNVADTLTQSVPDNVTSEMGLALLDVADVVRPHREVVDFLQTATDDGFLDRMGELEGGPESRDAIRAYLDSYGIRCVGEIDITRPRWSERPTTLLPALLGNIRNFGPGAGRRRFEQGRQQAAAKEQEVLDRLRRLPDGDARSRETKAMIDRVRTFIGYREYPKYGIVSRYLVYKQALLVEAGRLVEAGVLREREDAFYLTFQEFQDAVHTREVQRGLIGERKEAFRLNETLIPPRVLTSDGEALSGAYGRHGAPAGALVGLPVSSGTVEGRARVILDMAEADLQPGDILVTAFTDPSWTPLFVTITALVTEVGGLMTHGAVIAREYGLAAVVGVDHATRLIRDGDRIRVDGTEGYVEILAD
jgi:pyruvate,water dikinase